MKTTIRLPPRDEMIRAASERDASYDGVFVMAVVTTGIFCRPTCTARAPRPENIEFFPEAKDALIAGFRPCKRCRPMEQPGAVPAWLDPLLADLESTPEVRWSDAHLRARGLHPDRVRRWFQTHHGMSFQAYSRQRRLGLALGRIQNGLDVTDSAFGHGYESLSAFNDAVKRLSGQPPSRAGRTGTVVMTRISTPLGEMVAGAMDDAVCFLEFADPERLEKQLARLRAATGRLVVPGSARVLTRLASELSAYFDRRLRNFTIPLATFGTPFQESVWTELRRLPYGGTTSYAAVARAIGQPTAVRAVARANGGNRIAILIPCHRVVGSDGQLTGYGGGLWRKHRLLALELPPPHR